MSSNNNYNNNSSRSKKNEQQPPPGSLLSGSTWRPSSGPYYDTPNNVDGGNTLNHQPLEENHPGRVSGGCGSSSIRRSSNDNRNIHIVDTSSSPADPTPNSLTEPPNTRSHPRVKFRRAEEYKPQQTQGVDSCYYYGRTPNSLETAYTTTTFRETKNGTLSEQQRRRSSRDSKNEEEIMEHRTPLERWESRRERKNKEREVTTVPPAASSSSSRYYGTNANDTLSRTVVNEERAAHWSPVDDTEEEELNGSSSSSSSSSRSRGSDTPHTATIANASIYEYQNDDDVNHYSYMQQKNDNCTKQSQIDDQSYYHSSAAIESHERCHGNDLNDRRPDPLGHRQSSLVTVVDTDDIYTLASVGTNDNIRNVIPDGQTMSNRAKKGNMDHSLWKYNDDDDDNNTLSPTTQSSLSPSNIFSSVDDEKVLSTSLTMMKSVNDRKPIVSCLKNGSYTVTPTSNGSGADNGVGGARSGTSYMQDRTTASVISTPCDHGHYEVDIKPPASSHHDDSYGSGGGGGRRGGGMPEIGIPVFHNHSRVDIETPSQHSNRRHAGAIRMPRPAKEFCKRLGCEIFTTDSHPTTDKIKKKYPLVALAIFVVCVVIVAFTIHHIRKKIDDESRYSDTAVVVGTTASSIPSIQPTIDSSMYPSNEPTLLPTTDRERLISEYISSLSNKKSNQVGSPQYRAKMWILHEDNLKLDMQTGDTEIVTDETVGDWDSEIALRLKQRFSLATLYYSMGIGDGGVVKGWLDGDECRFVGNYGQAWDGVGCDDMGNVRAVVLDGANLNGTIPHDIALLSSIENLIIKNNPGLVGTIPHTIGTRMTQLRQLGLNGNSITGPIPKSILRLGNLAYLNLADNTLTGTIDWAEASHNLDKLERLILHNNQFEGGIEFHLLVKSPLTLLSASNNLFDGVIDESVGSMQSLEYLYLDGNKLVGSIPASISNLINLKSLNLDNNALYGTLPYTIGNLTSLEYLSANGNALTGGLPISMQQLTGLKTLNLASNSLSGHLRHLSQMTSLKSIHLYQNSFTGSIDPQLFHLPNLEVLFLSSNSLTGELPSEIGGAQKVLKGLYLSENSFHGSIPVELCALYKLEDLFVDSNNFNGSLPSCLADLSGLKRLYAFDNQFTGLVPDILHLPELTSLGLEHNNFNGGLETCTTTTTTTMAKVEQMSIWADCTELDGGCACCEKCCSDQNSNYC